MSSFKIYRPYFGTLLAALMLSTALHAQLLPNLGGQRAGISALTFLKNDISPRSMALGGANITLSADGFSAYNNPAMMAASTNLRFAVSDLVMGQGMHQAWLSGIIPVSDNNSSIGVHLNYLTTGAMEVRTEFQPGGTGAYFYANQLAAGLGYAKQLSDRFSFGANLKYLHERMAEYTNSTVAVDLGFLYSLDVKEMKFGIVVQNFGGNSSLSGDFLNVDYNRSAVTLDQFNVPTVFRLGASMVPYTRGDQKLMVAIQLEHPNDNSENIRLGVEYSFKDLLQLRAGIKLGVAGQTLPTLGAGYRTALGRHPLVINYAVNPTNYLGLMHGFGLEMTINSDKRE